MKHCCLIIDIVKKLSVEGLLSRAQVAIEDDSPGGVNTVWSLSSDDESVISDILLDDIQWAVQSRPANASVQWDTTLFDKVKSQKNVET